jgi:hypothetical protein
VVPAHVENIDVPVLPPPVTAIKPAPFDIGTAVAQVAPVEGPLLKLNMTVEQLSVEPAFTSEGSTYPCPDAFKLIVTSWHIAVGVCASFTVTVKVHVETLPFVSVAVYVCVVVPNGNNEPGTRPDV